ncbi:MAG: hypothetical protein LLF89_03920, partial [Spirochaetaceae bacterium]|nr:hypothetical protein [Spirochaetaceae bacterium]
YAFTLNLFLTAFSVGLTTVLGIYGAIQVFKYKRRVTQQDKEKERIRIERAQHEQDKHDEVVHMIQENRMLVAKKIDRVCERLTEQDRQFAIHEHLIEIDGKLYRSTAKINHISGGA